MPKHKNTKLETIDEVIEEIWTAGEGFKDILSDNEEKPENVELQNINTEVISDAVENKKNMLLKLAEDGDLDKSVAYVKKASHKAINKLHTNYECKKIMSS